MRKLLVRPGQRRLGRRAHRQGYGIRRLAKGIDFRQRLPLRARNVRSVLVILRRIELFRTLLIGLSVAVIGLRQVDLLVSGLVHLGIRSAFIDIKIRRGIFYLCCRIRIARVKVERVLLVLVQIQALIGLGEGKLNKLVGTVIVVGSDQFAGVKLLFLFFDVRIGQGPTRTSGERAGADSVHDAGRSHRSRGGGWTIIMSSWRLSLRETGHYLGAVGSCRWTPRDLGQWARQTAAEERTFR
jgi:hypothetical protein